MQNHWVTTIESTLLDDRLRELPAAVVNAVQVLLAGANAEAQTLLALSAHPVFSFRKAGDLPVEYVIFFSLLVVCSLILCVFFSPFFWLGL